MTCGMFGESHGGPDGAPFRAPTSVPGALLLSYSARPKAAQLPSASIIASSFPASAAKARMPSASFSVAIASAFSA